MSGLPEVIHSHDPAGGMPSTDLEAVLQRPDLIVVPLRRGDRALLDGLPSLGPVVGTTGKAGASCAWKGSFMRVRHLEDGSALFGEAASLCWIGRTWRHTLAALDREGAEHPPSLMLFGEQGGLAGRITPVGPGAWRAFQALVEAHMGCANCLCLSAEAAPGPRAFDCPGSLLREAWREARSIRDLDLRLAGLGVERLQAVRAMEGLYTMPVPLPAFRRLLERLVAGRIPLHLEVGNGCCLQILDGALEHLEPQETEWRLKGAECTLQIVPAFLQSVWGVVRPGPEGERFRVEVYDIDGERVMALACPLDASPAAVGAWEQIQADLERGFQPAEARVMPITSLEPALAKPPGGARY